MKGCKAGNGNPKCNFKRNAKGTAMYDQYGVAVACAYEGECNEQIELEVK